MAASSPDLVPRRAAVQPRSPLPASLVEVLRVSRTARDAGRKALADAEETLNKMFGDNEDRYAARAVLLNPKQAIGKLLAASEAFEAYASRQQEELEQAGNGTVGSLLSEREAIARTLIAEIRSAEFDKEFSILALAEAVEAREDTIAERDEAIAKCQGQLRAMAAQLERAREDSASMSAELTQARRQAKSHMDAAAEAQATLQDEVEALRAAGYESATAFTMAVAEQKEALRRAQEEAALAASERKKEAAAAANRVLRVKDQAVEEKKALQDRLAERQTKESELESQLHALSEGKRRSERRLREEAAALEASREDLGRAAKAREAEMERANEREMRALERQKKKIEEEKDKEAALLRAKLGKVAKVALTSGDAPGGDVRARQVLYSAMVTQKAAASSRPQSAARRQT